MRPVLLIAGTLLLVLMVVFAFILNIVIQKRPETRDPFRAILKKLILPEAVLLGVGVLVIVALLIFYPANEASARDGWIVFAAMWTLFLMIMLFNIRGTHYLSETEKKEA